MKRLTIAMDDALYLKIKKKSIEETEKKGEFVSMSDLVLPDIEKKFKK